VLGTTKMKQIDAEKTRFSRQKLVFGWETPLSAQKKQFSALKMDEK
jgi:hypothetical protein